MNRQIGASYNANGHMDYVYKDGGTDVQTDHLLQKKWEGAKKSTWKSEADNEGKNDNNNYHDNDDNETNAT